MSITFAGFLATLDAERPPEGLSAPLRALWLDRKGDWHGAHAIAQEIASADGARIHAYLHRKEGDLSNAHYWYHQAGAPPASGSSESEWEALARRFAEP
ncbi:MAG: hypothetical protein IRZ06_07060 [Nevskia sp.]|nr:hypothetical protein [Nevskia sp.]